MNQPDIRTLEGAKNFILPKAVDMAAEDAMHKVSYRFQLLIDNIWDLIPEGPGKTVAVRSIKRALMDCNSAISNGGQ